MKLFAHSNGHDFEFDLQPDRDRVLVRIGGREIAVTLDDQKSSIRTAFLSTEPPKVGTRSAPKGRRGAKGRVEVPGDRRIDFGWDRKDGVTSILIDGIGFEVVVRDPRTELLARVTGRPAAAAGAVSVRAPIPGLVTRVLLKGGDPVKKGQPVLCLDAMKLENEIAAPRDGVLRSIEARSGQPVDKGQVLFVVD